MSTIPEQLRLIADFFERHPDLPEISIPNIIFAWTKDEALKAAKLPGARKIYDDQHLWIHVSLSDELTLRFFTDRSTVCTAKRVEQVLQPAQAEKWVEKVVEWDCHPLLKPDGSDDETKPAQADAAGDDMPF